MFLKGNIVVIDKIFDIENVLGVCDTKEIILDTDIILQKNVIIALRRDNAIYTIQYPENINALKVYKGFKDFNQENGDFLRQTKEYLLEKNITLSWLQEMQIAEMVNYLHVDDAIEDLTRLYDNVLYIKKFNEIGDYKEMKYLDF